MNINNINFKVHDSPKSVKIDNDTSNHFEDSPKKLDKIPVRDSFDSNKVSEKRIDSNFDVNTKLKELYSSARAVKQQDSLSLIKNFNENFVNQKINNKRFGLGSDTPRFKNNLNLPDKLERDKNCK